MMDQLIIDQWSHNWRIKKCVKKQNNVDRQSILIMLIGDSKSEVKFDSIGTWKTVPKTHVC